MPRRLIIVLVAALGTAALVALGLASPAVANAVGRLLEWLERTSPLLVVVVVLLVTTLTAGIAATVFGIYFRRGRSRPPKRRHPGE